MKRKITLSIALVLSIVLVSLTSSDSTANAQTPQRFRFAAGVITPGAGQTLRVTVVGTGGSSDDIRVRFLWSQYMAAGCSGTPAVCRHTVATQGATPFQTLSNASRDALSFDVQSTGDGVNVVVESNRRDVRVTATLYDMTAPVYGVVAAFEMDILRD